MKKIGIVIVCLLIVVSGCKKNVNDDQAKSETQQGGGKEQTYSTKVEGKWSVRQFDDIVLTEELAEYPTLIFEKQGHMLATAGCNSIGGDYEYKNKVVQLADNMWRTEMMCGNEEMMLNEERLVQALQGTLEVSSMGKDSLQLRGEHVLLLVRVE